MGLGLGEPKEQASCLHNSVTRGNCFSNTSRVFCNRTRSSFIFAHSYLAVGLLRVENCVWRESLTHASLVLLR